MRKERQSQAQKGYPQHFHRLTLLAATLTLVLAIPHLVWAAPSAFSIEDPTGSVSGLGLIRGLACPDTTMPTAVPNVEIEFGPGNRQQAAAGLNRQDVPNGFCGPGNNNKNVGYAFLVNYNQLGAGSQTIGVVVDNVVRGTTTFTITTLGLGEFPTGLSGTCVAQDFPSTGMNTTATWTQSAQNFYVTSVGSGTGGTPAGCSADEVEVGPWCVDKWEASVFGNAQGSGTQFGAATDDYPATCNDNGNGCTTIFALSQAGVLPSANITWFQAQQACENVGKQLVPNSIWQAAAAGTPDNAVDCNINSGAVLNTGARAACVSRWGAFDMVGNVEEWVATWMQGAGSTKTGDAGSNFGNDGVFGVNVPQGSSASSPFPPALIRGGAFNQGSDDPGVFALEARMGPEDDDSETGFRCGRPK